MSDDVTPSLNGEPSGPSALLTRQSEPVVYLRRGKAALDPSATHYAVARTKISVLLLQALIRAVPVVRPDYVDEVLRRGNLPSDDPQAYEKELELPVPSAYMPEVSHSDGIEPQELDRCLLPSSKRVRLLRGTTLLFVLDGQGDEKVLSFHFYLCTLATLTPALATVDE